MCCTSHFSSHKFDSVDMKNCLPKCGAKSKEAKGTNTTTGDSHRPLETEMTRYCFKCNSSQSVAKEATVFVCTKCHSVNRLTTPEVTAIVADPDGGSSPTLPELISLRRINSSTFVPLSDNPYSETEISTTPQGPIDQTIGACSICLDAPGDMIFLQCNHGGFCEACARHIASNNAVGGAFCVKCRSPIDKVVRIVELDRDIVKAVPVSVQTEDDSVANKQPPKVPPPRGFNKAKKR